MINLGPFGHPQEQHTFNYHLGKYVLISLKEIDYWSASEISQVHSYMIASIDSLKPGEVATSLLPPGYAVMFSRDFNHYLEAYPSSNRSTPEGVIIARSTHSEGFSILQQHLLLLTMEG